MAGRWSDGAPRPAKRTAWHLGLPLPPFAGKQRLSFLMQPEDIVAIAPPPALSIARRSAPPAWRPTLDALDEARLAALAWKPRVFGSLAWRALTGLDYLTDRSDLDLLLHVRRDTDLFALTADVAAIEAAAPMRLDGELIRDDGAAVNWRELHAGAPEILVKSAGGVALLDSQPLPCRSRCRHDGCSGTSFAADASMSRRRKRRAVRDAGAIAASAVACLLLELETWPKPGLVSHVDTGSHDDMDADTFRVSVAAIAPYFHALADAGAGGCGMGRLRIIGLEAEAAMLAATSGSTPTAARYSAWVCCARPPAPGPAACVDPACRWARSSRDFGAAASWMAPCCCTAMAAGPSPLRRRWRARWKPRGDFPASTRSGCRRCEAGLRAVPGDAEAARVEACFALIAALEDTNLLHRGGLTGPSLRAPRSPAIPR